MSSATPGMQLSARENATVLPMADRAQLGMFGEPEEPARGPAAPRAPAFSASMRALGECLPETLRMGTSSWSFPGWKDLVYAQQHSPTVLAKRGLAAYVQHPLLQTVGVDRGFYAPVPVADLEQYAADANGDFAFLHKAHADCTQAIYPAHPRYGAKAGQPNDRFLDPHYATQSVVSPIRAAMSQHAGPILFQFSRMALGPLGGPDAFLGRLDDFLGGLPCGPRYAIELRNSELLSPAYRRVLRRHDVIHCINLMPEMPGLDDQFRQMKCIDQPELLVRWMLAPGLDYESAKQRFSPFNALGAPNSGLRERIAAMSAWASKKRVPTWVIVNNKAEGSSPLSIAELARSIARQLDLWDDRFDVLD